MTVLYSKVRDQIQTGDLLAWRTTKITSLISLVLFLYQKIFNAKFSHTATALRISDRIFVVEAVPPFVRITPLSQDGNFYLVPASMSSNEGSMIQYLLSAIGKPYSLMDFFKGLLRIGSDGNDYYCSELCADFYNNFGRLKDENAGAHPDKLVDKLSAEVGVDPIEIFMDKGNLS